MLVALLPSPFVWKYLEMDAALPVEAGGGACPSLSDPAVAAGRARRFWRRDWCRRGDLSWRYLRLCSAFSL